MLSRFVLPYADVGAGIRPSSGARLFFFDTGTGVPKDTFNCPDGTTANSNPVISDSEGVFPDIFWAGSFKVILKDRNDLQIWEADPVNSTVDSSQSSSSFILHDDLSGAKSRIDISEGTQIEVSDRGFHKFKYVTGETANGFDIIQHDTLALQLKVIVENDSVTAVHFGVVADDMSKAAQNDAALVAFEVFCTTNEYMAVFDVNGGTFHVTQDVKLPLYTDGLVVDNLPAPSLRKFHFTGAPNVIYDHSSQGKCFNISAETDITFKRGQFHEVNNILAEGHIILDPAPLGIFWCNFSNLRGLMIFDLTTSAINQNVFTNINPHSFDIDDWALLITDGANVGPSFKECHANTFTNFDVSRTKGIANQSNLNQLNYINGLYAEGQNGTAITANSNFDVKGMNFDGVGALPVSLENEVSSVTGHTERTGGCFSTIASTNICIGGEWDVADSSGKPPSFGGTGSNGVLVASDAPFGSGRLWGNNTSDDFSTVSITIPPILTSDTERKRFSMTGIWFGDVPLALTVGASSYDVGTSFTPLGSDYYIFRVTGYGDAANPTNVQFFITQASSGMRRGFVGNVWCSPTKTSIIPVSKPMKTELVGGYSVQGGEYVESGRVDTGFSTVSPVILPIVFAAPFVSDPTAQVTAQSIGAFSNVRFEKVLVNNLTSLGMDVEVYFNTDFTGRVHWNVKGI